MDRVVERPKPVHVLEFQVRRESLRSRTQQRLPPQLVRCNFEGLRAHGRPKLPPCCVKTVWVVRQRPEDQIYQRNMQGLLDIPRPVVSSVIRLVRHDIRPCGNEVQAVFKLLSVRCHSPLLSIWGSSGGARRREGG